MLPPKDADDGLGDSHSSTRFDPARIAMHGCEGDVCCGDKGDGDGWTGDSDARALCLALCRCGVVSSLRALNRTYTACAVEVAGQYTCHHGVVVVSVGITSHRWQCTVVG